MYDRKFFTTKLGRAAMLSILAMLAVNVVALDAHFGTAGSGDGASPTTTRAA
jgi:hypothetical protein